MYKIKSNKPMPKPQKQGGVFTLNLGQNNGPYLQKDIMPTNKKSMLLVKTEQEDFTQQSETQSEMSKKFYATAQTFYDDNQVYDPELQAYTNYDEKFKSKIQAAENITTRCKFCTEQVIKLKQQLDEYKELYKLLQIEKNNLEEQVNQNNAINQQELIPMLKQFQSKLHDKLTKEKNYHYKLQREIELQIREKQQIQQTIFFCQKRIQELEKKVGIETQVQLQDDEDEYDEDDQERFREESDEEDGQTFNSEFN